MGTLYCYKFNNYYNRQLKVLDSISDYSNYLVYQETGNNLNFNPNDAVNTIITIGRQDNPYNVIADYIIYSENNIDITSRWFIIESTRLRGNQYRLTLRRDLVADFYYEWVSSDCFIEKAILSNDSPLIYNTEQISTNQIKKSEIQLKDSTQMAWIVGFLDKNVESKTVKLDSVVIPDITVDTINDYKYWKYAAEPAYREELSTAIMYVDVAAYNEKSLKIVDFDEVTVENITNNVYTIGNAYINDFISFVQSYRAQLNNVVLPYRTLYGVPVNNTDARTMSKDKGKIIYAKDTGKYYKLSDIIETKFVELYDVNTNKSGEYSYTMLNNIMNTYGHKQSSSGNPIYQIESTYYTVKPVFTEVAAGTYTVTIPTAENRLDNKNAPFDIFCIPFTDDIKVQVNSTITNCNKTLAMSIASALGKQLGTNIYDIQLLPYCPFWASTQFENDTLKVVTTNTKRYTEIKNDAGTIVTYLFWSAASSGTFDIDYEYIVTNKKLANQVDMFRLVSPNGSGQFEFNAAKNNGIHKFNVDFTYLPYGSYIHVNPDFDELYGQDFNDFRGLICQGDFSIMYLSDAWVNYQTQNKNYLEIFNREIQNMETNRKYQRISELSGILSGVATMGMAAGLATGNPMIAGVAGGMSMAGGIADLAMTEKLYNETLDYKHDMFGYQLDNIKALPNSIAKSTAYTENNKIFPILEFYSCTDIEKKAVAYKIAYNSMTVEIIDKPINYISNSWSYENITDKGYIKVKLIRFESDNADDSQVVQALSDELYKGVYTK